jgi:ribosomal protein L37E
MNRKKGNVKEDFIFFVTIIVVILIALLLPPGGNVLFIILCLGLISFYFYETGKAKKYHLKCRQCGHVYKISGIKYALTPHEKDSFYIECPKCGYKESVREENEK